MKSIKLCLTALALLAMYKGSNSIGIVKKHFDISYYWYSVEAYTHQTGVFKIKARLSSLAGSIYTISPNGHGVFRYGFVKTVTNNPGITRIYTLFYK